MTWVDSVGDLRAVASSRVLRAITERVCVEVERHREYAKILGLNETETDARLDGIAVAMRERCSVWERSYIGSIAELMVRGESPVPFDSDEVEKIMRATSREVDDRRLALQIVNARSLGFVVWSPSLGRCEGPATREVHERETMVRRSGLTPRIEIITSISPVAWRF